MKHLRGVLALSVFFATLFSLMSVRPAHASCLVLSVGSGQTVSWTYIQGHSYTETDTNGGSISIHHFIWSNPTQRMTEFIYGDSTVLVDESCEGNNGAGPVTWFTPGDARLDPRPGDKLAVYCNAAKGSTPTNIAVLGIINNQGQSLINRNVADVANKSSSFSDGLGGSVLINGVGSSFTIQWFNTGVGANGAGDFSKTITCTG